MPEPGEIHISSLVVHVGPAALPAVRDKIAAFTGAEIRGESARGKLVLVLETERPSQITETIEEINQLPGVIGSSLVYHQFESAAD